MPKLRNCVCGGGVLHQQNVERDLGTFVMETQTQQPIATEQWKI